VTDEQRARHDAYRHGLCVDCRTAPHSAGRTRCGQCHRRWTTAVIPPGQPFVIEIRLIPDQENQQ